MQQRRGGLQGDVYLARSTRDRQLYAIKQFKEGEGNLEYYTDLENSWHVALDLRGVESVTNVYEILADSILVMEYVEGRELADFLKEEMSREELIKVGKDLVQSIKEILAEGVLPIDLDDGNVMVATQGNELKVIDLSYFVSIQQIERDLLRKYQLRDVSQLLDKPVKVYKDSFVIESDEGERIPVTLRFVIRPEAINFFELFDAILRKVGISVLRERAEQIEEEILQFDREIATFGDLKAVKQDLDAFVERLSQLFLACLESDVASSCRSDS